MSRRNSMTWPVRSVIAGFGGTAAMTLAYRVEHELRPRVDGPLDYDDSLVPGEIVASVMHLGSVSDRTESELGHGAAVGLRVGVRPVARDPAPADVRAVGEHRVLRDAHERDVLVVPDPRQDAAAVEVATRRPGDELATHVAYVVAVAIVDDAGRD